MTARLAGRLAWGSLAVYVLLATAGIVLLAQTPRELVPASDEPAPLGGDILLALTVLVFAVVGALVAGRLPRHPVGWLMCAIAVLTVRGSSPSAGPASRSWATPGRSRRERCSPGSRTSRTMCSGRSSR